MGWKSALHKHHDHNYPPRFPETVICDLCNSADASVKIRFRCKMHPDFSFSPEEIQSFIRAYPHGWHEIDYSKAWEIYCRVVIVVPHIGLGDSRYPGWIPPSDRSPSGG
jgi:hypothetical protein